MKSDKILKMPYQITPLKVALRTASRKFSVLTRAARPMQHPPYPPHVQKRIRQYHDEVRYSTLALAVQRILDDSIPGAFAEVGVYQGVTSHFLHTQAPDRDLYLFDTFEGFPKQDLEVDRDERFTDTSMETVAAFLGPSPSIKFRKGYFPETAVGLENEKFSLVMLDVDLYRTSIEVLNFFYPRMTRGGYVFLHDFNSTESDRAISRALYKFMMDKPELIFEIPDFHGSALFRKI